MLGKGVDVTFVRKIYKFCLKCIAHARLQADIQGYVAQDRSLFKGSLAVDLNETYAAALAVGTTRGVARGAHLETITVMDHRNIYARASDMTAAINKILSACADDKVICIVALPQPYRETRDQVVSESIQKRQPHPAHQRKDSCRGALSENSWSCIAIDKTIQARASRLQRSKDVIAVAPASDQNRKAASQKNSGLIVHMWVPSSPILDEGDVEIDMWLAAVMRAAGVTASFVSWYWNEKQEKPDPEFIKRQMLDAILLSSSGLCIIHIPNTVSGRPDLPIPNQLPPPGKASAPKRRINDQQSDERRVKGVLDNPLSIDHHLDPAFQPTESNIIHIARQATPLGYPKYADSLSDMATG
ncbi:hypothetical protein H0H93_008026, partial [Arthromyces matolae]